MGSFYRRYYQDCLVGMSYPQDHQFNLSTYMDYYDKCIDEREYYILNQLSKNGHNSLPHPEKAINAATISTLYLDCFRIHSKKYFYYGDQYYKTWDYSHRKERLKERFSPFGVTGYYFGLTLNAAFDEANYYSLGKIDESEKFILTIDCCFDNILYLMIPGVLIAVWEILGFEFIHPVEMFNLIIDRTTCNDITNQIGLWARHQGFDGIIYPSARYGQREHIAKAKERGKIILPLLNPTYIGTSFCQHGMMVIVNDVLNHLWQYFLELGKPNDFLMAHTEPNLVLFNNRQLTAIDRTVFYRTLPLNEYKELYKMSPVGVFDVKKPTINSDGVSYIYTDPLKKEIHLVKIEGEK